MPGVALPGLMSGTVLSIGLPVLLVIFGGIAAWTGRKRELAPQAVQASIWLFVMGLISLALYFVGDMSRQLSLRWAAVVVLLLATVLCVVVLQSPLRQPLKAVSWLLLFNLLLVAGSASFSTWSAGEALRGSGDSNPDEAAVRAALARNPDDAAAHSSLAHLKQMRRDMPGAMAEWRQVLRVEPDSRDALLMLGTESENEGKVEEARGYFQRLAAGDGAYSFLARRWLAKHPKR